ncbi:hypothetical protein ACFLTC_02245 [Chloroflexota bacterium]
MIARKKLNLPKEVSGRPITNRGVHLQPFGFHGRWLERAGYWTDLLVSMGMSWVVLLTDGDSVRQEYHQGISPLKALLDAGIIPIIREKKKFPEPFTEHETVRWTVDLYGEYGLKPFWIVRNEPFDDREWRRGSPPRNAWDIIMEVWSQAAQFIASNGGYIGFPDGPGYSTNPFERIKNYDCQWIFDQGLGFYTGHHYGKNRPRDYPYDAVTRYGAQLTGKAYHRLLDDYAGDRRWMEEPLELLNQRRSELQSPDRTSIDDDTCWRGWEKIAHWSLETFGYVVPMAMTEGGWVPRDRPGTGPDTDIRMPHTTPKMVAKKSVQMYDTPSPFFSICPWLLADEDMGGSGWPFDAWHGWAYRDKYGTKKPVITTLQQLPAKEIEPRTEPMVIDVNGDTRDWAWVEGAYGAKYRRGTSNVRLIESHEYEGPATLDVWVVDSDGLPVAGVVVVEWNPGAPAIGTDAEGEPTGEWYDHGIVKTTGPDGRISFRAGNGSCTTGTCSGAIWPKGKGDVLENLGLLKDTSNRHLNGMWQLVGEDTPAPPPPSEPATPVEESEAPAVPLPPVPEPGEEPEAGEMPPPPPEPDKPPETPPPPPDPRRDRWALLSERLERIEELIAKLPKE